MDDAIGARGLTKDYGAGRGIFDLDLSVAEGEVFGFLGPNGAGKTTTIRVLMGLARATRGSASLFGLDAQRQSVEAKRLVGFVPGELPAFGGWKGSEIVAWVAGLRGGIDPSAVSSLARRLDLDLGRRYREYSHGNKQKLALLIAFAPRPKLLILDEPTTGLDPLHQQAFYELVREARAGGATVFLSSHVLSEVEHVCDRVGMVRAGRLVTAGPLSALTAIRSLRVEIVFEGAVPVEKLRGVPGLEDLVVADRTAKAMLRGAFEPLLAALAGSRVATLRSREPSLEELFLSYYR